MNQKRSKATAALVCELELSHLWSSKLTTKWMNILSWQESAFCNIKSARLLRMSIIFLFLFCLWDESMMHGIRRFRHASLPLPVRLRAEKKSRERTTENWENFPHTDTASLSERERKIRFFLFCFFSPWYNFRLRFSSDLDFDSCWKVVEWAPLSAQWKTFFFSFHDTQNFFHHRLCRFAAFERWKKLVNFQWPKWLEVN